MAQDTNSTDVWYDPYATDGTGDSNPDASSSNGWSTGWLDSILNAATTLTKAFAPTANPAVKPATTTPAANWQKYLPWLIGGAVVLGLGFVFLRKK